MKMEYRPMTFTINPNIIVQDVKTNVCGRCGMDSVSQDEYELVRKKVHRVAKVGGNSLVVTYLHKAN